MAGLKEGSGYEVGVGWVGATGTDVGGRGRLVDGIKINKTLPITAVSFHQLC